MHACNYRRARALAWRATQRRSCQRACVAQKVDYDASVASVLKEFKLQRGIAPRRPREVSGRDGRKFARAAMDFRPLACRARRHLG
eukprot:3788450-Pyramimonas_sp.AAC.1